jgi:ABC-type lipoprotein export system ATPase subunit
VRPGSNRRASVASTALRRRRLQSSSVVELLDVGRTFGTDPPVVALDGVDLTVQRGSSVAIVGPSGSGKTTLLNLLGCLDRPSSGTYRFEGIDVGALSEDERAALRAHRIGFVFQSFNLLGHRTVLENVMLAEVYRGIPRQGREARALDALRQVRMEDHAYYLPPKLWGGEQQRVAIARAIVGDHSLLLCDEPTGSLDSANTEALLALFDELGEAGLTRVTVTHDDQVAAHADRRVRMIDGELTEGDA